MPALALSLCTLALSACGGSSGDGAKALDLTILHINDHHSHLDAETTTLTLKKGVVAGVSIKVLYDWINTVALNRVEKRDIMIRLCDENGVAVITWKVLNAFPTQLDAPGFSASANDVAIESMQLTADAVLIEES